jgi:hypothetical protein
MGKINPYFLFCQGLLNSPVVGQSRGCADHKKRPDYLAEAQVAPGWRRPMWTRLPTRR